MKRNLSQKFLFGKIRATFLKDRRRHFPANRRKFKSGFLGKLIQSAKSSREDKEKEEIFRRQSYQRVSLKENNLCQPTSCRK
jgi:hypothetical protein